MNLKEVGLEKITIDSKTKLENLISLYLHDLSEFADDLKINEDGKFEYEGLELYFKSKDLTPFFITYRGEVVGFVLFNTGKYAPKDINYVIHELFILKSFRNKGVASDAIKILMDTYKGKYKVVQISTNKTAVKFWMKFYENQSIKFTEAKEKDDDLEINVQIFNV
ncbi:GNAT family N-acetyltransferase [Clostridium folliculivorans]|uniref:Acetyltransferase n=1 Tax=Clostridium folliculivorans TaxID=2886038 RepID=A0A9W5Y0F5_9CLOT|nr:GNAT family N-acetyltransferase [Clostridium folliculivorans]GKU24244.1 acetyltransferase [Clostridium folliculivorans]GKU30349.1 acetyltransferase [Clostridium folliculivorans]